MSDRIPLVLNSGRPQQLQAADTLRAALLAAGQLLLDAAALLQWGSDLLLQRDGAGILSQRNATNAQEQRIYRTYTDAANGEWGAIAWNGTTLEIGAHANGSGTVRPLSLIGVAAPSHFGYSTAYTVLALGGLSGTQGIALGLDPATNAGGNFVGDGADILVRRGARFVTPNSTNTDWFQYNLVLKDGRVGVGVGAPQTSLELVADFNSFIMRCVTGTAYASFRIYNDANSAVRALEVGYAGSAFSGSVVTDAVAGESAYLCTTGAYPLHLGTNNTARWYIGSTGHFLAALDGVYDLGGPGAHRPRNVYAAGGVATKVKAGTPTDADFTNPVDGMIAGDTTGSKIWIRLGGSWKGVTVA